MEPILGVPRLSQMTWQDVGGAGWCSPTAVSLVLAHASGGPAYVVHRDEQPLLRESRGAW